MSKLMDNILIDKTILSNICKYCEDKAVYDKLSDYGDFYYKIKAILSRNQQA